MQTAVEARKRNTRNARSTAADGKLRGRGFRRYKDERRQAVRIPKVVGDEVLAQLREAWESFEVCNDKVIAQRGGWAGYGRLCDDYEKALTIVRELNYGTEDVRKFSIAIAEFQDDPTFAEKAGLFLSALINSCADNEFVINTRALFILPTWLGFRNIKNITVEGDVGEGVGKSSIDGCITVRGNAGNHVGNSMKGGEVIVKGDAGSDVGHIMKGGEIHLEGSYEDLGDHIDGGKIFHRGRQIYPKLS